MNRNVLLTLALLLAAATAVPVAGEEEPLVEVVVDSAPVVEKSPAAPAVAPDPAKSIPSSVPAADSAGQNGGSAPASATESSPKTIAGRRSVRQMMDVIAAPDAYTMIPKGAVLYAPKNLRDRLPEMVPDVKFLNWWQFFNANGRWLLTEELTLDQATGKAALPEARKKAILSANRIVVAVLGKNPIRYEGEKILDPSEKNLHKKP